MITLPPFLPCISPILSHLSTWVLKGDHTIFEQGYPWSLIFLTKITPVFRDYDNWLDTGLWHGPVWQLGVTTTKTIPLHGLTWNWRLALRGSSGKQALGKSQAAAQWFWLWYQEHLRESHRLLDQRKQSTSHPRDQTVLDRKGSRKPLFPPLLPLPFVPLHQLGRTAKGEHGKRWSILI